MTTPTYAVSVRLESELEYDEIERIMTERAPEFRALDGLIQKYYLQAMEPGVYGGFYLWRSLDDAVEYRESELAATIASAYQTVGTPRIEVYRIVMPLRD